MPEDDKHKRYRCVVETFNTNSLDTELAKNLNQFNLIYGVEWKLVSTTKVREKESGKRISILLTFKNRFYH